MSIVCSGCAVRWIDAPPAGRFVPMLAQPTEVRTEMARRVVTARLRIVVNAITRKVPM